MKDFSDNLNYILYILSFEKYITMTSTKVVSQHRFFFYFLKYTHFLLWHVAIARLPGLPGSFSLVTDDRAMSRDIYQRQLMFL